MGFKIVALGIPGVGKSTVISDFLKEATQSKMNVKIMNFGTVMLEEAISSGVCSNRDEMRRLSLSTQKELQKKVAMKISQLSNEFDVVVVDTHLIVRSRGGYLLGLPRSVLSGLQPDIFAIVVAPPEDILVRRTKDVARERDALNVREIETEQNITIYVSFALAAESNANAIILENKEGQAAEAGKKLLEFLG